MKNSRRNFLKTASLGAIALVATATSIPAFALKKKKKAGAGGAMCDPAAGTAKTINYKADKKNVPAKNQITKMGVEFKDQSCDKCQLYQGDGKCMVLPACKVAPKGWCTSWSKKA